VWSHAFCPNRQSRLQHRLLFKNRDFTQNPTRLLLVASVSFGDVFSNLPSIDEVGDVDRRRPLKHK
jgi:hypothetical protein